MNNEIRGINSPYYLGDFLPYFFQKNKNQIDFKIFFEKTGIDPERFESPMYLVGLSSKEQYHSVREYFELGKVSFLKLVIEYDQKGALVVPAMERRQEMLEELLKEPQTE